MKRHITAALALAFTMATPMTMQDASARPRPGIGTQLPPVNPPIFNGPPVLYCNCLTTDGYSVQHVVAVEDGCPNYRGYTLVSSWVGPSQTP